MGAVGIDRPDVLMVAIRVALPVRLEEELVDDANIALLLRILRCEAGLGKIGVRIVGWIGLRYSERDAIAGV